MDIVAHRRNTVSELMATPSHLGIEVDIRSHGDKLIIHHEAFVIGESFDDWLDAFNHGLLILNVKEEGLEQRLISMMSVRGIENYFFLDQSFPFLIRTAKMGEKRCAARVSEFETIETALALKGMIDWVWIDCFSRFPLDAVGIASLRDSGFRLCVVSPELQGRLDGITTMRSEFQALGFRPDAVCTKVPELWI